MEEGKKFKVDYSIAKLKTDGPSKGEIKAANSLCKENLGKYFVQW